MFPRRDEMPVEEPYLTVEEMAAVTSNVDASVAVDQPVEDYFALRPSDSDLLIVDETAYDSQGIWENDPPLPKSTAEPMHSRAEPHIAIRAEALFGEDFEEEIPLSGLLGNSSNALRTAVSEPQPTPRPVSVQDILTINQRAAIEEHLVAMESQLDARDETLGEFISHGAIDEPVSSATLKIPTDLTADFSREALANWTMDVAATEMDREVALHIEIEDLVSQLNFSAFAVEPFSVEQIDIDYQRQPIPGPKALQAGTQNSERETIYSLHTAESEALASESFAAEIHNNLSLDDDRDLLIIEEELPLSSKLSTPPPETPPAKATSYSQLFAKLRH